MQELKAFRESVETFLGSLAYQAQAVLLIEGSKSVLSASGVLVCRLREHLRTLAFTLAFFFCCLTYSAETVCSGWLKT